MPTWGEVEGNRAWHLIKLTRAEKNQHDDYSHAIHIDAEKKLFLELSKYHHHRLQNVTVGLTL